MIQNPDYMAIQEKSVIWTMDEHTILNSQYDWEEVSCAWLQEHSKIDSCNLFIN